ncbi:MAG: TIGR04282 family arsenosugar biosynthesis glycosyltransferase [Nitrospirota bacterium]
MHMDNALIIFAKAPVAGIVKTRLFPHVSFDEAAELQRAFLVDITDMACSVDSHQVCIAYSPKGYLELFRELFRGRDIKYYPQEGSDLGEKMSNCFQHAFREGARKVIIIGSDIPLLPPGVICDAFGRLDRSDLVLGPAKDGGYYLIGLKAPIPELFHLISWSGPDVISSTLSRSKYLGISAELMPSLQDVDTFDDLRELSKCALPPNTRSVMKRFESRLNSQPDWFEG